MLTMSNIHTLDSIRRREESQRRNNNNANYGGYQISSNNIPSQPIDRLSFKHKIVYTMIGINCMTFIGWQINPNFMLKHFMFSKNNLIYNKRYHVLLTSNYSHSELVHLGFNMYSLYHNGLTILDKMKFEKFLILYCGSGIFANLVSLFWNTKIRNKRDIHSLGASGCLMGLNIVLGLLHLYKQWQLTSISERDFKEKVKKFIMESTGKDILFLLFLQAFSSRDHAGHLGGALFGWLFWKYYL